eukprot:1161956-Pelagomonas_calceolata.AAC.26
MASTNAAAGTFWPSSRKAEEVCLGAGSVGEGAEVLAGIAWSGAAEGSSAGGRRGRVGEDALDGPRLPAMLSLRPPLPDSAAGELAAAVVAAKIAAVRLLDASSNSSTSSSRSMLTKPSERVVPTALPVKA